MARLGQEIGFRHQTLDPGGTAIHLLSTRDAWGRKNAPRRGFPMRKFPPLA